MPHVTYVSWEKDFYLGAPNFFDYVCTHFINVIDVLYNLC
jgi:hypothetical protein